jgi:hygromycin-B 7''-O-kinase
MSAPPLPTIQTAADLDALRADVPRWRAAIDPLLVELGLADLPLRDLGGGNLVVGVGERLVLKLTPPVFGLELDAEHAGLAAAAAIDLPVPSPAVIAHGFWDHWRYLLLTRIPGRPLDDPELAVAPAARAALCHRIGAWLAALHAAPAPALWPPARSWEIYREQQLATCIDRQARWGVPPAIVAAMPGWLAAADLDREERPRALLHADVHDGNVLCQEVDGTWRMTGVIDFGDSLVGDPLFDLITPALLIGKCDPVCMRALLDGYGLGEEDRGPDLVRRLTAFAIIHRWNDLTRVLRWAGRPIATLDELAAAMFPIH